MTSMTCAHCGTRLVKGVCYVQHCKLYGSLVKQIVADGKLPFGQNAAAYGMAPWQRRK